MYDRLDHSVRMLNDNVKALAECMKNLYIGLEARKVGNLSAEQAAIRLGFSPITGWRKLKEFRENGLIKKYFDRGNSIVYDEAEINELRDKLMTEHNLRVA